jgi:acyl-CoA synthetase (AMP-forming)/AMP-acid ligase II
VLLFASAIAGRPFTPLNYRLTDAELQRNAARAAPAVAVVDGDMVGRVAGVDGLTVVDVAGVVSIASAASADPDGRTAAEHGTDPDDVAVTLFTSGTTGEPKAALLRHRHLTSYVMTTLEFAGADPAEAALVSVPPYHIAGIAAIVSSVYVGRRMVYLPNFTPQSWVTTTAAESVTHAMVVPTMLGRILDLLEERDEHLPALRHLSYGGGRMPVATIERALGWMPHVDFVNAYGLTETSSTIAVLAPSDHRDALASDDPVVRGRLGSVGRPSDAVELTIRDPDGVVVPAGVSGEIWVRGEQVSGEYAGQSRLVEGGWFPTNDAGYLDDGGYLFVEGRLDDVIVRGGENISPGEIEDLLRRHPAIEDIAVYGVPSQEWGEEIAASVVVRADAAVTADELRDFVRAELRSTKTPTHIEFRAELPYGETGKLLRRVLKADFTASDQ